jgi:protein-tyrosine phosphatase
MALTPGMTSISNFRELGGLPTADGRVVRAGVAFRSAHLAKASDTDLDRIVELGISTIIDLRTPADKHLDGHNRLPDGVRYVAAPMGDLSDAGASPTTPAGAPPLDPVRAAMHSRDPQVIAERFGNGQAEAMIRQGQRSFVDTEQASTAGRAYLEALLDPDSGGALVHCSAGKDRTGWICTVVLLALNVERPTIIEHYLETNQHRPADARLAQVIGDSGVDPEHLRAFFEVRESYQQEGFDIVDSKYGSAEAYLEQVFGFDATRLAALRSRLLVASR